MKVHKVGVGVYAPKVKGGEEGAEAFLGSVKGRTAAEFGGKGIYERKGKEPELKDGELQPWKLSPHWWWLAANPSGGGAAKTPIEQGCFHTNVSWNAN